MNLLRKTSLLLMLIVMIGAIPVVLWLTCRDQIAGMVARHYGHDVTVRGLDISVYGGVIESLNTQEIHLDHVTWTWFRDGASILTRRIMPDPDIHIGHLVLHQKTPGPADKPINPLEYLDQLRRLALPAGHVFVDQVQFGDLVTALDINSQSGKGFTANLKKFHKNIAGMDMQGAMDFSWDGRDLVCQGALDAEFVRAMPIIGTKLHIAPDCHTANPARMGAKINIPKPDLKAIWWQQALVTVPLTPDWLEHFAITLSNSPTLPEVKLLLQAGNQAQGMRFKSEAVSAQLLSRSLDIAPISAIFRPDRVDVSAIHVNWGDGRITLDPMIYNLKDHRVSGVLTVQNINPSLILTEFPIKGLALDGIFDGTLPFDWASNVLTINQGVMRSQKGILRYVPDSDAAGSLSESGGKIAMQALGNFHYDDLTVMLNGQQGGNQSIQMTLNGRNPELYEGYPVILRLNLTGALEDLLQQGRATMSLPERLKLERLKKTVPDHINGSKP